MTWISTSTTYHIFLANKLPSTSLRRFLLPQTSIDFPNRCVTNAAVQAMLKRSRPDRTKQQAYLQGAEVRALGALEEIFWFPRRFNESWRKDPPEKSVGCYRCFIPFPVRGYFYGFMLVFGGCIFWLGWGGDKVEKWCC